jgi:hypothetical protein
MVDQCEPWKIFKWRGGPCFVSAEMLIVTIAGPSEIVWARTEQETNVACYTAVT